MKTVTETKRIGKGNYGDAFVDIFGVSFIKSLNRLPRQLKKNITDADGRCVLKIVSLSV